MIEFLILIAKILFAIFNVFAFVVLAAYYFKANFLVFLLFPLAVILAFIFIPWRITMLHPGYTSGYAVVDFFYYLVHKEYNRLDGGKLNAYIADFGGGKTLSIVHEVYRQYRKYNNKQVWDRARKQFVTQKIHIISNVEFTNIPFEPLRSLSQIVAAAEHNGSIDEKNNTRTVTLTVIDEASALMNSRNFKGGNGSGPNIDPIFLNSLLTCRHYHISIFYSTQKFNLTDKLLRDVTQRVIHCHKIWRFMVQDVFNATDVEYASDPTMVKPIKRTGFLVRNIDYQNYDTLAVVSDLKKRVDAGDMMSEEEILALRGNMDPDNESVTRRSGRLKRRQK